jgi:hypothetical protein
MSLLHALWGDEGGFVLSSELVLIATVVVIGLTVGLVSIRDAVLGELADVGAAIGSLNQSYWYHGVARTCGCQCSASAWAAGGIFWDRSDGCDPYPGHHEHDGGSVHHPSGHHDCPCHDHRGQGEGKSVLVPEGTL